MRILVVDDERAVREVCSRQVQRAGFETVVAGDGAEAWERYCAEPFPVVLTDLDMPRLNGLELIRRIRDSSGGRHTQIVVFSASLGRHATNEVLRHGVFECVVKPQGFARLPEVVWRAIGAWQRSVADVVAQPGDGATHRDTLSQALHDERGLLVVSDHMREVVDLALRFHEAPGIPVLIQGDTGTGKEAVARLVHRGMKAESGPFVDVNCAAVSPTLLESELFGYEPGAFTGANRDGQVGKFEQANGGTIFLDELGEMPRSFQSKLLRVLEEGTIRRVGGTESISVKVRIICATNRDLAAQVANGEFREDLYYRLSVGVIRLRPLCQRAEAIEPLANCFLHRQAECLGKPFLGIHEQAMAKLMGHNWPGNIRELRNVIDRAVVLHSDRVLRADHLEIGNGMGSRGPAPDAESGSAQLSPGSVSLPSQAFRLEGLVNEIVAKALQKNGHNKSKTARYLGLSRSKLLTHLARKEVESAELS